MDLNNLKNLKNIGREKVLEGATIVSPSLKKFKSEWQIAILDLISFHGDLKYFGKEEWHIATLQDGLKLYCKPDFLMLAIEIASKID